MLKQKAVAPAGAAALLFGAAAARRMTSFIRWTRHSRKRVIQIEDGPIDFWVSEPSPLDESVQYLAKDQAKMHDCHLTS